MHIDIAFIDQAAAWIRAWTQTAVGFFVLATLVDVGAGVVLGVRQSAFRAPDGRFDPGKLPGFLGAQYGTRQAAALGGLVVIAALSPNTDIVNSVLTALTVGATALGAKVAADAVLKVAAIFGTGPVAAKLRGEK